MIILANIVSQQNRSAVIIRNQHIYSAVVVEIADGEAPRGKCFRKNRPTLPADILKRLAFVPEKQQRLFVSNPVRLLFDEIIRETIGNHQIQVAVVIVIEKLESPPAHPPRGHANAK